MSRVDVVKKPFTARDQEYDDSLSGVVEAFIKTMSHIHVSMGRERLETTSLTSEIAKQILATDNILALLNNKTFLEKIRTAIALDYVDNIVYGDSICIPGSTIKGLLRSRLELTPSKDRKAVSCMHTITQPITELPKPGTHGWRHARVWSNVIAENRGEPCDPASTQDYTICVVCDLFGAPGVVGRVMPSNFCCSRDAYEKLDLPYGEKVYAIKPNTVLRGFIHFSSLRVEELGVLLISMGITRGRTEGVPLLIGKHKYAYRNMGKAVFGVSMIRAPHRFKDFFKKMGLEVSEKDFEIICDGQCLQELINKAIDEALKNYPQLEWLHGFSEASERDRLGVAQ